MKAKYLTIFLIALLTLAACKSRLQKPVASVSLADLHQAKKHYGAGSWTFKNPGGEQTFELYKGYKPNLPDSIRRKIYLQPIGSFSPKEFELLAHTKVYFEALFELETALLPTVSADSFPESAKREKFGWPQYHTHYLLYDFLKPQLPADAIGIMGITSFDIYPQESWNFVFGQATLKARVGVASIYRIKEPIYKGDTVSDFHFSHTLDVFLKIASHEMGHIFSIHHCSEYECLMNGSNSLLETRSKPNFWCPNCEKKLFWGLGLDSTRWATEMHQLCKGLELKKAEIFYRKRLELMEYTRD